jgi:hypothetical protein
MTAAPLDLHKRVRFPLFVLVGFVTLGAAYYTGTTGDAVPLLVASSGLGTLLVLTTDYEKLED